MIINHSHHDAIFKKFMGDLAVARVFLEKHVPASLRPLLNFNTLTPCPGSFVETNLRHRFSDLLYSVQTPQGEGYIYCLLEHQSSPEKLMAFRLMRYSLAAMQQHLDNGHAQLPLVIPLMFYHGCRSPYPYTNNWLDCFSDPQIARQIYCQPFPVIDITVIPDHEIMTHGNIALLELVQKHIRARDMTAVLEDIASLINRWPLSIDLLKSLLTYLCQTGNAQDVKVFISKLQYLSPAYQEEIMTIAQQLEALGKREGMFKGMKEGRLAEKEDIARQLYLHGIDTALIQEVTGLSAEKLESLQH